MKYVVTLAGREVEVEVDGDHVTVAGRTLTAALRTIAGTSSRQLLLDGRPSVLTLRSSGRGQWTVARGGDRWEAEVLDERTRHIRSLTAGAAADLASKLRGRVGTLKVGLELFLAEGRPAVDRVRAAAPGAKIFLDLKLCDIPETVGRAVKSAAQTRADLLTVHASGGPEMLRRAVAAAAARGSVSEASTRAAPAFLAAMATRPEPVAKSRTVFPATSSGRSRRWRARPCPPAHAKAQKGGGRPIFASSSWVRRHNSCASPAR